MCVCIHVSRIRIKNDRYTESESKSESVMHFGSRCFEGKEEEEERRRSMFRNAWGACLGLGLFFFWGGAAHVFSSGLHMMQQARESKLFLTESNSKCLPSILNLTTELLIPLLLS